MIVTSSAENFEEVEVVHAHPVGRSGHILANSAWAWNTGKWAGVQKLMKVLGTTHTREECLESKTILVFGSTQNMLRGCSCLCISDLKIILFKKISGLNNAGVSWYSRIWVEEQRLRRGARNKESRAARVKSTMFIVTYTMCNTHPPTRLRRPL